MGENRKGVDSELGCIVDCSTAFYNSTCHRRARNLQRLTCFCFLCVFFSCTSFLRRIERTQLYYAQLTQELAWTIRKKLYKFLLCVMSVVANQSV